MMINEKNDGEEKERRRVGEWESGRV